MKKIYKLYDSEILEYNINLSTNPIGKLKFYNNKIKIPEHYYTVYNDVKLLNDFTVKIFGKLVIGFDNLDNVIDDSLYHKYRQYVERKKLYFQKILKHKNTIYIDSSICVLNGHNNNYFHWITDCLTKIIACEHYSNINNVKITYIILDTINDVQKESLKLMGVDFNNVIFADNKFLNNVIKCKSVLYRNNHRWNLDPKTNRIYKYFDAIHPSDVFHIKEKICKNFNILKNDRKILIDRIANRRILNKKEIIEYLSKFDYELVFLENMSLEEQITLFKESSHIISVNGAALANLIFCDSCSVLEIHCVDRGVRPEYFQISFINKLNYYFTNVYVENTYDDVIVPIDDIKKFVDMAH